MQDNQMQAQWWYIAGIMDADGSFYITRSYERRKRYGYDKFYNHTIHTAIVRVSMVEKEAISLIMKNTGFGTCTLTGARQKGSHKNIWEYTIRKREEIISFLKSVIPFLQVKPHRAKLLLEFIEHKKEFGKTNGRRKLTEAELTIREDMYFKMREFNGKKAAAETKP